MPASIARADLSEDWVILVWNSFNQDSQDIAEEYLELHPNVISCDLDIEYTTDFDLTPPECGIISTYITPCKFREVFLDGPSNFTNHLAANPNTPAS
jgi:hypothetical protein